MSGSLPSGTLYLTFGDCAVGWRALCCVMGHSCLNSILLLHIQDFSGESTDSLPCTSVAVVLSQKVSPAPELQVSKDMIVVCDQCYLLEKQGYADTNSRAQDMPFQPCVPVTRAAFCRTSPTQQFWPSWFL